MAKSIRKPARRWWQYLLRAALMLALLLGAGYVTLPWWLPPSLIQTLVQDDLQNKLGLQVRIGSARLSWSEGVELRDVRIQESPEFGAASVVDVRRIRADFSPIHMLLHRRLEWMEIDQPRIQAKVDPGGNVNLAPLSRLRGGDLKTARISVRGGLLTLKLPAQTHALRVQVSDLQVLEGKLAALGRVTLSAALLQEGQDAPLGLQLSAQPSDSPLAATASFHFSNIDLQQLALLELARTPIRKLSGRCSGRLDVKVNRQGVIDRLTCGVGIQDLDVQPASGPKLPVIEQAGVSFEAVYDPIDGDVQVNDIHVRLPGLTLAGRLVANANDLSWETFRALELAGEVAPSRLAAVLTGKEALPGELSLDGPVALRLRSERNGDMMGMRFLADATACGVRQAGTVLKPQGRRLQVELRGTMDRRSWQLAADQTTLLLGDNRFVGSGALSNIRRLAEDWTSQDHDWSASSVLADLTNLNWAGTWEIVDLPSLIEIAGPAGADLAPLRMDGPLTGGWSIDHKDGMRLTASIAMPAGATLTWDGAALKPAGVPAALSLSGKIDPARAGLEDIDVDCTLGQARLFIDRGYVFPAQDTQAVSPVVLDAGGKFEAQRIETLGACLPRLADLFRDLRGRIDGGRFLLRFGTDALRLNLTADLTELAVSSAARQIKPAGQQASLVLDVLCDRSAPPARHCAQIAWKSPQADLNASLTLGQPGAGGPGGLRTRIHADIRDARCLAALVPALADPNQRLAGAMALQADLAWQPGRSEFDITCDADGIDYTSALPRRVKKPGIPLRLRLAGNLNTRNDKASALELRTLSLDVGRSSFRLGGQCELLAPPANQPLRLYPPPGLAHSDFTATARLVIEPALIDLLPELAKPLHRHALDGTIRLAGQLNGDREKLVLRARADADDLAAPQLGPIELPALDVGMGPANRPAAEAPAPPPAMAALPAIPQRLFLAKPAGLPARGQIEITLLPRLNRVLVNNLLLRLGALELMADASADLVGPEGDWTHVQPRAAHLAVWTRSADRLHQILPVLRDLQLSGDFHLDCELAGRPDGQFELALGRLTCEGLRARYLRKDLLLSGRVLARGLLFESKPRLRSLQVDNLELRAGENHAFVLADLADLGGAASGSAHLMIENLDDKDLVEWLAGEGAAHKKPGKLTPAETHALRSRAGELIAQARGAVSGAKIDVKFDVRELHSFDPVVNQYFDVNHVTGQLSLDKGVLRADYRGGIYGGTLTGLAEIDLTQPQPAMLARTAIRDAAANPTIQAQLAKSFPNNTAYGRFTHEEELSKPLDAVVANMLDARFVVRPVGTAKTVALDGLTRGRAAPLFVTRIFPGLNLADYRYRKMTAFAQFLPDGRAVNDMVFDGSSYDLFVEGSTDPDNIGRYVIGLILLAAPQSPEWNHAYKQGRIPILNFKARIEDAKMYDVEVSYPWPDETLGTIFLKNNIVYRLWVNAGRK